MDDITAAAQSPIEGEFDLNGLPEGARAAVFGAGGGIGGAFARLIADHDRVGRLYAATNTRSPPRHQKITDLVVDITDEASVAAAAHDIGGPLDLVIVATGVLHTGAHQPEKSWRSLTAEALIDIYRINTIGPALVAKHFLPLLPRDRRAVFAALSARVGSISDNRLGGWHAYRASKAGLNMLIRNFAIEMARRNKDAVVVGLHPGTVDSDLSKPFQNNVPDGKLFTPQFAAASMLRVLDGLGPEGSGRCFAWDGQEVPA